MIRFTHSSCSTFRGVSPLLTAATKATMRATRLMVSCVVSRGAEGSLSATVSSNKGDEWSGKVRVCRDAGTKRSSRRGTPPELANQVL